MTILLHASVASCLTISSWAQKTWRDLAPARLLLWRHLSTLSVFANFQPHSPLFYPWQVQLKADSGPLLSTFPSAGKLSPDGNKSSLLSSAGVSSRVSLSAYFYMKSHSLPTLQKHPLFNFFKTFIIWNLFYVPDYCFSFLIQGLTT